MIRLTIFLLAALGLVACGEYTDDSATSHEDNSKAQTEATQTATPAIKAKTVESGAKQAFVSPKSMRMLPDPELGALETLGDDDDSDEVDLYSAVITAASCAKEMAEDGNQAALDDCEPIDAARSGYAIYDPTGGDVYLLDPKSFHRYELEEGFQGSMDITGSPIGKLDDLLVLNTNEFSITPKPPAGAFKGCL